VGGDGNDEIYAFNAISAPGGTAFGGDGDDMIWLGNGRENGGGHVVYGEAGDDVIYRSGMGDALYGDFGPTTRASGCFRPATTASTATVATT
jgi:hypothetical protein